VKVQLLDLSAQHNPLEGEIIDAISRVVKSQHFILGPEVEKLEKTMAERLGVAHAFGVSSGTDALVIALMAEGVGAGDEVITSTYSFFATGGAIARVGAKAVFVDVEENGFQIDVGQVQKAITPKTRAIIPVHLFGLTADMAALLALPAVREQRICIIEDAAQAIDVKLPNGKWAGTVGDYGCYSFFPSKNLGAMGDAGLVVTNDPARAKQLKAFRAHGAAVKYFHDFVGGNFRIDAMQAAVLNVKAKHLDAWTAQRRENAAHYHQAFASRASVKRGDVVLPPNDPRHSYNQFVIHAQKRDALKAHLQGKEIQTEVYYPVPFHMQKCFASLGYKQGDLPRAEKAAHEALAIPVSPGLTREQLDFVVDTVDAFYA
jgi:dTDP-4-amino-4,6-dideoxygalactose transaminase